MRAAGEEGAKVGKGEGWWSGEEDGDSEVGKGEDGVGGDEGGCDGEERGELMGGDWLGHCR